MSSVARKATQFVKEKTKTAPFDKRTKDVDTVSGCDLLSELYAEAGIEPSSRQQG
ncbi:hypothetical protein ACFL5Q_05465 [Planctomycetota bacterium]